MINGAYNVLLLVFYGLSKWSLILLLWSFTMVVKVLSLEVLHTPLKSMWYIKLGIHFECIFFEENTFLWIFGRFWEKSLEDCVSNILRALDYQRIENWSSLLFITDREELRRSASWTLSGIVLPEDRSRGRTKPSLSKRMKSLVESQKRRILVFRNGESSEGVEIVAGRFDEVQSV